MENSDFSSYHYPIYKIKKKYFTFKSFIFHIYNFILFFGLSLYFSLLFQISFIFFSFFKFQIHAFSPHSPLLMQYEIEQKHNFNKISSKQEYQWYQWLYISYFDCHQIINRKHMLHKFHKSYNLKEFLIIISIF